jgi:Zn-finger protein
MHFENKHDYAYCSVCGCKVFYHAKVHYADFIERDFSKYVKALCRECAQIHEIIIRPLIKRKPFV